METITELLKNIFIISGFIGTITVFIYSLYRIHRFIYRNASSRRWYKRQKRVVPDFQAVYNDNYSFRESFLELIEKNLLLNEQKEMDKAEKNIAPLFTKRETIRFAVDDAIQNMHKHM